MPRDFFDPTPEHQNVTLIGAATLRKAERLMESCEHCHPDDADILFDWILDRVTGSDPSVTDYLLEQPAKCPNCLSFLNGVDSTEDRAFKSPPSNIESR